MQYFLKNQTERDTRFAKMNILNRLRHEFIEPQKLTAGS